MNTIKLSSLDIGSPRLSGTTKHTAGRYELVAGGEDIWGTRDEFHFAYTMVAGNFELSARADSLSMADVYTKAGLMLRASLAEGAEHAMLLTFGDNQPRNHNNGGLEFQSRAEANGPCTGIYPPQPLSAQPEFPADFPHVWLKLIRTGATITARSSRDGVTWKTYCTYRGQLPHFAYLGLAVTSHHPKRKVKGVFSQLNFTQAA